MADSRGRKVSHYYSAEQDSRFVLSRINAVLRGIPLTFFTAPGVFSKSKVDAGTALLVESVKKSWFEKNKNIRILDIGCGYGVVGIVMAKEFPGAEVVMSDVNRRALKLTEMNAKENGVDAKIVESFLYEGIAWEFDLILSNPPQSAGKDVCLEIFRGALEHLKKGGIFIFVARHRKGGKSLSEEMKMIFGNCEAIAMRGGYRVYLARKN